MDYYPNSIENIRRDEFPQLQGGVYLDHAGTQLPPNSLITAFANDLTTNLYGNPHSSSAPSTLAGARVDGIRLRTLRFFGADPQEYDCIFVANTTAAIKLVGDACRDYTATAAMSATNVSSVSSPNRSASYSSSTTLKTAHLPTHRLARLGVLPTMLRSSAMPWKRNSKSSGSWRVLYHRDAHTSIVGLREAADSQYCFENDKEVETWMRALASAGGSSIKNRINDNNSGDNNSYIASPSLAPNARLTLFAYPGQSNMTGRRLPTAWPAKIRNAAAQGQTVLTLLDAAALATTKKLSVSTWAPDFVALSFYKIFGFPDLGALLVRKTTGGKVLDARRYFGGGTVDMVVVSGAEGKVWHAKKMVEMLHERHEDGTVPFHNIIALDHAMDSMQRVYGSMEAVSLHTASLSKHLYDGLMSLKHSNGAPIVQVYAEADYGNTELQGATVAFSVLAADGSLVPYLSVEKAADTANIYLRSGGLCNPGGMAFYLGWSAADLKEAYRMGHTCSSPIQVYGKKATGVVRASLGACSSVDDIKTLLSFLKTEYGDVLGMSNKNYHNSVQEKDPKAVWMWLKGNGKPDELNLDKGDLVGSPFDHHTPKELALTDTKTKKDLNLSQSKKNTSRMGRKLKWAKDMWEFNCGNEVYKSDSHNII